MIQDEVTPAKTVSLVEGGSVIFRGNLSVQLRSEGTTLKFDGQVRESFDGRGKFMPFQAEMSCQNLSS